MEKIINNKNSITKAVKDLNEGDILVLEDGIYHEKIEIWQSNITIKAKNKHQAILTNKDYYHKIMPNHNECNTFNTFTLFIGGDHVILEDIIVQNEAVPSNLYGQAVALHVDGTDFLCQNCIIKSAQDTLFTGPMPKDLLERYQGFYEEKRLQGKPSIQHYLNCEIIGDVDFIFGGATVLFEACNIISLDRSDHNPSYICAPCHTKDLPFGYLFYRCTLKGSSPTYLARPWRDYGCAAFIECSLGNHILPAGFNKWNNTNRDQTARFYEYSLNTDTKLREPWSHQLNATEAKQYLQNFKEYTHLK